MPATVFDIYIEQGALYEGRFSMVDDDDVPIDLTGWTARMQIRAETRSLIPLVDLSTENEGIFLNYNGLSGSIFVRISTRETDSFTWVTGIYDLELYDTQFECYRVLKGKVKIDPQITRVPPMIVGLFDSITSDTCGFIS